MSIAHFNPSLTATQYAKLRSAHYEGERLVSLFSNRVVFAAQVNSDLTTPTNWAQFDFSNVTVGAWTDIIPGQALYIGTVDDITQATFLGRIRKEPTSSIIYSNESSQNFDVGDYCWVVDRYDITYVYSRPSTGDPATAVELVNYDEPYQDMRPSIRGLQTGYAGYVNPSTGKLRLGFDVSQSLAANSGSAISSTNFAFDGETVVAGALNESIVIVDLVYGEQWGHCTVDDDGGQGTTRHFGIKVHDPELYPPDTGFKGGSISATLDQGYTLSLPAFADVDDVLPNTFAIVWRNDEMYGSTEGGLYGNGVSASITNKQLTSSLATLTSAGLPFVPGQVIIIADVGSPFNGTFEIVSTTVNTFSYTVSAADIASTPCGGMGVVNPRNVDFVGWLMNEEDPVKADRKHSVISGANFSFTGVGPRLSRLVAQLLAIRQSASPTTWGDITNLTPWRAIWHFLSRYTTIATLCDVWFDDVTDTYLFPDFGTEGNALSVIQTFAQQIDCNVEFAPWGAIGVNKDVNFDHAGTVVNQWTSSDFLEFSRSYDPNPSEGLVDGDGAFYNSTNAQVTDYTARAPGIAQGEAEGRGSYPARVLASTTSTAAAKAELLQRTGDKFVFDNLKEFFNCTWRAPWVGAQMMPSRSQVSTLTLDGTLANANNVNRLIYDQNTQWTIESISTDFDEKRGFFVNRGRIRRVTEVGDPADDTTQTLPAPNEIPELLTDYGFPAFPWEDLLLPVAGLDLDQVPPAALLPPKGMVASRDGQYLLVASATRVYWLKKFLLLKKPIANEITPSDLAAFRVTAVLIDQLSPPTAVGAYVLANDGANSRVWYTVNAAAPVPVWTNAGDITGIYTQIRAGDAAGTIEIYAPSDDIGAWTHGEDLTASDGGMVLWPNIAPNTPTYTGVYTGATGWQQVNTASDGVRNYTKLYAGRTMPASFRVTMIRWTFDRTLGANNGGLLVQIEGYLAGSPVIFQSAAPGPTGAGQTYEWTGDEIIDSFVFNTNIGSTPDLMGTPTGTCTLTDFYLEGEETNPFGGGGGNSSLVLVSMDYAVTFGSPVTVGTSPGAVSAIDTERVGPVSIASAQGQVRINTSIGGAYGNAAGGAFGTANPVALLSPYYAWGSTSTKQVDDATPDYATLLDAAVSGGTLKRVTGAGSVTDITPTAGAIGYCPNALTSQYGTHLAALTSVAGTKKCYVTTNAGAGSPTWALALDDLTAYAMYVRTRRNDTRAKLGGNRGQLYVADGPQVWYSIDWGANFYPRTMPVSDIVCLDILG